MHPDTGVPPRMEDAAVDDSWVKISRCTFSDAEYKYLELVSPAPALSHNESSHAESRATRKEPLASQPQVVNLWVERKPGNMAPGGPATEGEGADGLGMGKAARERLWDRVSRGSLTLFWGWALF